MKNALSIILIACLAAGCKKTVEEVQENLVLKAMTDGQWRVTRFKRDTADFTAGYAAYRFQFRTDRTVEAVVNGSVESKGTWNADATAKTIASSFNGSASAALQLLNGTWLITNNSWTFVEATQTVNNEVRTLRIDK